MEFKITRIFLAIFTIFSFLNLKAFAFNEDEILIPNVLKKGDKVCLLDGMESVGIPVDTSD